MPRKLRTSAIRTTVLAVAVLSFSGCRGVRPDSEPDPRAERQPEPWSVAETTSHLRFLNGREADGRASGSVGFGHAAAYVEARMREYGLQPVAPGAWRHLYFTPLNSVTDARVVRYGADTLSFGVGDGIGPDPRSASGGVRAGAVDLVAAGAAVREDPSPVIVIGASDTSTARLGAWAARGVEAAIAAVRPMADRVARPAGNLVVVQAEPDVVSALTGVAVGPDGPLEGARLDLDIQVEVAGSFEPAAAAINILGYVGGRDPYLSSELVLIGAAMDGRGRLAGSVDPDTAGYAVAATAVLEAARVLADLARTGNGPDRTVLFVILSGSRQGGSGVRAWFRNPTWPAEATRAAFLVGETDSHAFRAEEYPVHLLGSDSVPPGPGSLEDRGARQAATMAYEVLSLASGDLWHRGGATRLPPYGN